MIIMDEYGLIMFNFPWVYNQYESPIVIIIIIIVIIIIHYYPLLSITIHYYPLLSITIHYILSITIHGSSISVGSFPVSTLHGQAAKGPLTMLELLQPHFARAESVLDFAGKASSDWGCGTCRQERTPKKHVGMQCTLNRLWKKHIYIYIFIYLFINASWEAIFRVMDGFYSSDFTSQITI